MRIDAIPLVRAVVLLSLLLLGGCQAISKTWKVLKNPDIAVGGPEDRPSMVAYSLVASADANPTQQPSMASSVPEADDAAYRIHLSSSDLGALLAQLKSTAETLQGELEQRDAAFPEGARIPRAAGPAGQDAGSAPPQGEVARALGEYADAIVSEGPAGATARPPMRTGNPVRVRVFQLKDDGVFLALEPDGLQRKPEDLLGKTYLDHDDFLLRPGTFRFVPFHEVSRHTRFIAVVAGYHDPAATTWKAVQRIEAEGRKYPLLISLDGDGVSIKQED